MLKEIKISSEDPRQKFIKKRNSSSYFLSS